MSCPNWTCPNLTCLDLNCLNLTLSNLTFSDFILEFGVPVWNPNLTKDESYQIERVQKAFLHIVLGRDYIDYEKALNSTNLESLEVRRINLSTKFAKRSANHPKHKHWFALNENIKNTRRKKPVYKPPLYRLERYRHSPIPYLTSLLNEDWSIYMKIKIPWVNYDTRSRGNLYSALLSLYSLALLFITSKINRLLLLLLLYIFTP